MTCPHCKAQSRPDAIYCESCSGLLGDGSSPAGLRCPHCGYEKNKIGEKLCFACSMPLLPPPPAAVFAPVDDRGNRGQGLLIYILGIIIVLASWIGAIDPMLGWVGFVVSSVGLGRYKAKQPAWVGQACWIVWGVGMVLIVAAVTGNVSADMGWAGLLLTIVSGSVKFIDFD